MPGRLPEKLNLGLWWGGVPVRKIQEPEEECTENALPKLCVHVESVSTAYGT